MSEFSPADENEGYEVRDDAVTRQGHLRPKSRIFDAVGLRNTRLRAGIFSSLA